MIYTVLHPMYMQLDETTFARAIKNYVKMNRNINISNLIIQDQMNNMKKANLKFYKHKGKSKANINIQPYNNTYPYNNPYPPMAGYPGYIPRFLPTGNLQINTVGFGTPNTIHQIIR